MAYRELELSLLSARDLKNVNLITRMEVYAVVTISGDPLTRQCTAPDPYGGRNPNWNATFRFAVPPTAAAAAGGCFHVLLRAERVLGDRDVGEVIVPLAEILAGAPTPGPQPPQLASYQVRKVHRWEPRGVLNVSYRLGPVVAPVEPQPQEKPPPVGVPLRPSHPQQDAYPPPPPPHPGAAVYAAQHQVQESPRAPARPPRNEKSNGGGPSQVCVGPRTQIILGAAPAGPANMAPPTGSSVSVTTEKPKQRDTQAGADYAPAEPMSTVISPGKVDRSRREVFSQNSSSSSSSTLSPFPGYTFAPSPSSSGSTHPSTCSPYSTFHHPSTPSPQSLGQQSRREAFGAMATNHTNSPRSTSTREPAVSSPLHSSLLVAK